MAKMSGVIQNNQSTTKLINELKSSSTQYPPLNKQQERDLIEQYRNDRDKLNELLYMHNIRLAFNMAKKYATKTNDFDSLVSDCLYGLSIACQRFDIDKGIKFSTYATTWIFKYCLSSFYDKQNEIDRVSVSINEPHLCSKMKSNNGNEVTFENYVNEYIDLSVSHDKPIEQSLSSFEMTDICKNLMQKFNEDKSLSAIDKHVFIDGVFNKEKTKDIAEKYNIAAQDVTKIKNKVLSKFKDILLTEYNISEYNQISC